MKVTINCPWMSPCERTLADGTISSVNKHDPSSEYAIDLTSIFSPLVAGYPPEKRVFVAGEPSAYMNFTPDLVERMGSFYKGFILSWHGQLKHLPQTRPFRMGSSWVSWETQPGDKKFGVGAMFSGKSNPALPGYAIRRRIASLEGDISIPSMVYSPKGTWKGESFKYPLPSKKPSLDYMFHFAIENCSEEGYFTEKIVDCFTSYSVPVYFGDPRISDIFVADGIVVLDEGDIAKQANVLTPELYRDKLAAILENRRRAERYWHFEDNIVQTLKEMQC